MGQLCIPDDASTICWFLSFEVMMKQPWCLIIFLHYVFSNFFCPLWDILSLNHCEPVYFSSKHRSHKLARLKVDDEVGHVKSGDLTRIRGQNGPGDDYLAAAAWHSTVYGATKREKSPSTQLNLSLVEKKLGLRFQTSLYFKLKLLSRTMSLLPYSSSFRTLGYRS